MGVIDWNQIHNADVDFIANDEDAAEAYFELLSAGTLDLTEPNANDPRSMAKLFDVSKAVLKVKGLQYETALDEMEKITQEASAEREKELLIENQQLTAELDQIKKELVSHDDNCQCTQVLRLEEKNKKELGSHDDNYQRTQVLRLEEKNKMLEKEIAEFEGRLLNEKKSYERVSKEVQDLETRYNMTKNELDRVLSENQALQRQFQSRRENMIVQRNNDDTIREEINKKNRELSSYLDEIKQLQDANDQLQEEVNKAKTDMEQATNDMNLMADDYTKLKSVLEDTDQVLEDMRKERDLLRAQVQDMQVQLQRRAESDDEVMVALNKKVAEWKDILIFKDKEIALKDENINNLENQLKAATMDSDRAAMMELMEANRKKDEQIKELKQKIEMATKDYADVTSHINTLKAKSKDGSPSIQQQMKIQMLNKSLVQEQSSTMRERQRVMEVEQDVMDKDKQITELVNRLIQYEQGQYGLSEAVHEIKECRALIRARDQNIEDLTKDINELHAEVNDLNLENEEMRERLGIGSREELDIEGIKKKRAVKEEQAQALNRVLQKEVEKLEEERVQLKQILRKQAIDRGERAAILGISSKQLEPALEEVITPSQSNIVEHSPAHVETINRVIKAVEKGSDEEISFKRLEKENKELKEEIHQLEIGMREIHGALKAPGSGQVFQVPSLDKLIAIIQERHATGQYDTTVQLKAEVSHLLGRNEEVRSELRNAQAEISQGIMELNKKTQKMDVLEKEVESLRELNEGVVKLNPLPLPEGVAPTSKDIIACLNEYLIQILQELSNKEELCEKMESNLEEIRRNYSVATHQQSILYKEFLENQKEVEEIKKKFNEEKESLMHSKNENDVKVQEFQKLLENLQVDPSSHKKLLAELTRKITVLRVNEKSLTRRYTVLQDTEKAVRKENAKLHNGMMELEAAVTKKIGDLQRHKEMSVYKITSLQKSLEDTVPSLELDQANRQFNELTAKYRDLLQKENQLAAPSVALDTLKAELKAWQHSDKTLKDQLQLEKEKSYVLEQTLNDLITKLGEQADGTQHKAEEVTLLARKMATLEIKELNERERADHANTKYEQMRSLVTELENRNSELEQKFAEISKVNLECQRIERELRDELTTCVPADVNRANKTQIKKMEEKCGQLQNDNSRLKELAEISQHQVESITMRQQSQEKELISIRKRLNEMQMETDEKTVIAKLHQQIVALQVSESAAVRKLEVANKKLSRTDALNLKLQGIIDEKDEMLFQIRYEGRSKSKFLKKTIQDLRRQFSGALTLGKQEKFSTSLRSYQQKKLELEKELQEARNKRILAEDQSLELQLKLAGLQDLIVTLKDSQGAKKVAEWHNRMSEVKLEDLKLKREIENLKEQMRYYENMITKHENTITLLEEENIKQTKEFEDRQLLWEQHEVELERSVAKLEKQQRDIMEAAQKFEEATGSILDESMPISHQLEIAIGKIKEHIKTIIFIREETNRAHEKMQAAETKLRAAETSLMQKDKVINELRLRLPISERNYSITDIVSDVKPMSQEENRDVKQALKIAQTTADSLKLMLQKKDENISKYQQLLEKSRKELQSQSESHHHEMKLLQDRLQLEVEEHIKKMKKIHHDYINAPQTKVATNEQLQRLSELEEIVEEQDTALGTASEKYRQGKASLKTLKERLENNIKLMNNKMKDLESKHVAEVKKLKDKIEIDANMIREKELEIEVLHQELEASKEANERAPSKTMKNLVERLRNQLAKKDKEQKSLSQALLQLRSDMVSTAEENVHAYSKKMEEELNVQKLVERETNQLNDRIEDLQIRMEKLRKELRKKKESENELNSEIETLKKDNLRKENALKELALELRNREDLVEKYDKLKADYKKMEKTRKVTDKKEEVLQEDTIQAQEVEAVAAAREFSDLDEKPVKESKEEIIRWEESKKWQKKIENLKTKLKDKTSEYVQCEKTNTMLREAVARQEKDKMILQNRLKSVSKGDNAGKALSALNQEDTIASLKSRIFQLEDENNELVRKLNVDRDREFQELQIQNNQLKESLRALETELMNQQKEFDPDGYTWNLHREQALQKEMLDIRKENMELRFEIEQATKDCPRLKARVEDLTEYTEILKGEIESLRKKDKSKKVAMGTGMGGQSVEDMERVIAAMRRVVERLQTENESLKKQAGKPKPHSDLVKENRILKQEVQRLKQVQTKTDHKSVRVSTPPATVKVIQENDKLRKELKKEKEETEQLRVNNDGLRKINEKLQEELEEKNQTISAINRKAETMTTSTDRKLNKSIVVSKLYDQKIKSLENEVQKKNSILKEIKSHLRGSAEREAELLRKIDELEDKVTFLQNYPPGNHSDQDSAKLLQQTRLQVRRLEAEKKELQFELERLRKITSNGETPVDVTQDEVLEKLRSYDKMLAVEVDLRTRIKGMEIEREKLYSENKKLKKELSAFDPSFFEELEDLKYNYKKAVERNIVYENQLRELSKQFGVNVNIRPSHDESL